MQVDRATARNPGISATRVVLCCIGWLWGSLAAAEERPRIGLALSGGSARGAAHVGVIKVLEEYRVPVDYVAGTSMGAIVGGLYAAGYSPAEIDRLLTGLDWDEALTDRVAYRDLFFRRKEDARRYLTDVEIGVNRQGLAFPVGLISGQKLGFELTKALDGVSGVSDFDDLPTPFRAVTVDVETAETVVLATGSLVQALRASMSIPGVFSPIEIDGRLLVDGGLANNVPVDVVRAMGADVVIAVDVSEPLMTREEMRSFLGVGYQALGVMMRVNMESRLADADLVVTPEMDEVSPMAFEEARQIIDRGEEAARRHGDELSAWSLDASSYVALAGARPTVEPPSEATVQFVRVEGHRRVDERTISSRLGTTAGDRLDWESLGEDLDRVFALAAFEQASFRRVEEGDRTGLVLEVREKSWGPTYLLFGLNLTSDLEGENGFTALVNLTRRRLNPRGGEWRNELRAGESQGALTELYQPLDFAGRFFVAPRFELDIERQSIFEAGRKIGDYEVRRAEAGLDLGLRLAHHGELRLGALVGDDDAEVETGSPDLPSFDSSRGGWRARLEIDSTDAPAIPRHGWRLASTLFLSRPDLGADLRYDLLELRARHFASRGRHTFFVGIEGGSGLGSDVPVFEEFRLGGLLSLGGYAEGQLRGPIYGVGRLGYHHRLIESIPALGSLYAGFALEAGNVWASNDAVDFDDLRSSATFFLVTETFFGPFFVGYGVGEDRKDRFYLSLGQTF